MFPRKQIIRQSDREVKITPHSCCLGRKPGNRNFAILVAKQVLQQKETVKRKQSQQICHKQETVTDNRKGWKTFWMIRISGA
jgi:hypothetical protein